MLGQLNLLDQNVEELSTMADSLYQQRIIADQYIASIRYLQSDVSEFQLKAKQQIEFLKRYI